MGIYIDEHFFSDLFIKKNVKCNNTIYALLYNTIWPCDETFKKFLSSSDISLKIDYAKSIYYNFSFINDIFLPRFSTLNVLKDQIHTHKDNIRSYVPQDHYVHCINLYILGIYLFFNSDIFSKKILSNNNDDNYIKVKAFIQKWQIFALYHDVGYHFEDTEIPNKNFESYKSIYYQISHYIITKHITRTLTFKALSERSKTTFDGNSVKESLTQWYQNGSKVSKETMAKITKEFSGSTYIEEIKNDECFSQLLPLIPTLRYLITVHDELGTCVAIIIKERLKIKNVFTRDKSPMPDMLFGDYINSTLNNFTFKYFIPDLDNESFWRSIINEHVVISDVYKQLPKELALYLSINNDSIQQILLQVYNWVYMSLPLDPLKEDTLYEKNYFDCKKGSIKKVVTEKLLENIPIDNLDNDDSIDNCLKELKKVFMGNQLKKLKTALIEESSRQYEVRFGTTHNFIEFYKTMMNTIKTSPCFVNANDLDFIHILDKSIESISLFEHKNNHAFPKELYIAIEKHLMALQISMDDINTYKVPYSSYDHGIMSAGLLYQSIAFQYNLQKYCSNTNILSSSWLTTNFETAEYVKICADAIFAILIHNIYTKKSRPNYGIEYSHNIENNCFSYFCTMCDTIQKWGRYKLIDSTLVTLPSNSYLEDEFDINISEGQIHIHCLKKNFNDMKNTIQSAEEYLPGITKLVTIEQWN